KIYSMQFIKTTVRLLVFFLPFFSYGQSVTLPAGSKFQQLADRMDIKLTNDPNIGFTTSRPLLRKDLADAVQTYYNAALAVAGAGEIPVSADTAEGGQLYKASLFTAIDRYNMSRFLINNIEWYDGDRTALRS